MNPLLKRMEKQGSTGHGRLSEKRVAKSLGAKLHPASGAMRGFKSDASGRGFRYEMKSTTSGVLKLEEAWLLKIVEEALCQQQNPALVFSFVNQGGNARSKNSEWVAIPKWLFEEMRDGE